MRESEGERKSSRLLVYSPDAPTGQHWAVLKPETGNSVQVYHMGDKNPIAGAITTVFHSVHQQELEVTNLGTVIRDVGVLTSVTAARPNTCSPSEDSECLCNLGPHMPFPSSLTPGGDVVSRRF